MKSDPQAPVFMTFPPAALRWRRLCRAAAVVLGVTLTATPCASASSAAPRPAAQGATFGATQQAKAPTALHGGAVINVTSAEQFNTLLQTDPKVIVDFTAVWCGPCKLIKPAFERFSTEPEYSTIRFAVIDVDQVPDVSEKAGIRAMPTFLTYLEGRKKGELLGADPNKQRRLLDELAAA